jgi:hypothetical protein
MPSLGLVYAPFMSRVAELSDDDDRRLKEDTPQGLNRPEMVPPYFGTGTDFQRS